MVKLKKRGGAMKKINNYFPHDFNARNDIKLKKVIMELGLKGIGLYWCIIEYLYENGGYLTLDEDIDLLAYELRIDKESIIDLIEKYDLFKKNKNKFYSPSVLTRLEVINEKSNTNRKNALKRWHNKNTNAMRPHSEIDTNVIQTECYIKKKKKKENKINKNNNSSNYLTTTTNYIYSFVEENFGRTLSGVEIEKINIWLSEFNIEILKYAISIAVMNNKRTFAYVEGILKNWKSKGYKNIEEIKEDSSNTTNHKTQYKELFDYNWLEEDNDYNT